MLEIYINTLTKNYVNFSGRAGRKEFWYFVLINFVLSYALGVVGALVGFSLLGTIYSLGVLLPSIGIGFRRMQDVGKPGWFILIPIYNIILAIGESQPGDNEHGPQPQE
ncbi:MAG TPA: DUF805 domain-containing protein [Microscillaceae bacterium]|nr:DUF805 domain-containing protein [Microscillaceae bacterium]